MKRVVLLFQTQAGTWIVASFSRVLQAFDVFVWKDNEFTPIETHDDSIEPGDIVEIDGDDLEVIASEREMRFYASDKA